MDENNEFKMDSGAVMLVTMASFEDAKELHDAVVRSFLAAGGQEKDLTNMETLKLILVSGANKEVERALFKCADRAIYKADGTDESAVKVNRGLFDLPKIGLQARAEYYPICMNIVEVNLKPFYLALFSLLKTFRAKPADTPTPESQPAKP